MIASDAAPVVDIPRHTMMGTEDSASLHKPGQLSSQESAISTVSSTFSAPAYVPFSSNVSTTTVADTEPASSAPPSQGEPAERAMPPSPSQRRGEDAQAFPRDDTASPTRAGNTTASPMLPDAPLHAQGCKRTASGLVKGPDGLNVRDPAMPQGHKRTKSSELGPNRIGELSAQLKTRLSYAMMKVQNGWEKRSLDDLEDETSQRSSPVSGQQRPSVDAPPDLSRQRRPSGISDISDHVMLSPDQRSSRPAPGAVGAAAAYLPSPDLGHGDMPAPAPKFSALRKRRFSASFAPPPMLNAAQRKHQSDLGASPQTPMAPPRPGILRMPSHQAEKDAVDTLLFLSSPKNATARFPSGAPDGPVRSKLSSSAIPPRRVMFENSILKDQPPDVRRLTPDRSGQYR